ncbi:NAD-binding protein [Cupriavidus sp. AcVe19-1a]|uniref:NAD-binding protein n=1 Tax=Cupriavidus sp. AcVe19-1a TaxID=2821359 RepID=UPI001AE2EC8B
MLASVGGRATASRSWLSTRGGNALPRSVKTWLLAKDLSLAVEAGREVGARLETAETAYALMTRHAEAGGADLDATSLVLHLSRNA